MFKNILIISTVLLGASSAVTAVQAEEKTPVRAGMKCAPVNHYDVIKFFDRWNASLQTHDPVKVAENYSADAVLLPTLSAQVRYTNEERIDYFKDFLKKNPVARIDSRTIRLGCNKAIDNGIYTFRFKDGSEATARYTFTYAWDGARWLITSHHSSVLPKDAKQAD
ncbi:DUF4440 domain-containing protein [Bacillus subtilis]|nr:DUF4440 domain-containing protein [Pseudochrobactrum asaccharolyticum]MCF7645647.1 DUF4440 domain-containing protein [Pseudochrobactrum asaccharolyticum]MCF7671288.1 DUF4440 domain-containing protein [Bacillus subtilis]